MRMQQVRLVVLILSFASLSCDGFSSSSARIRERCIRCSPGPQTASSTQLYAGKTTAAHLSFLMDDYRDPTTGEIIDPYQVLKVNRRADIKEIKLAYRALCRRYHPDVMRGRDILPGSCNNMEDVRNQWERVKLSYEILSNPVSRKRYDRNEAWADPGKAVQRAASQAAADTAVSVGKSVWGFGSSLVQGLASGVSKAADKAAKDIAKSNVKINEKINHDDRNMGSNSTGTHGGGGMMTKWRPEGYLWAEVEPETSDLAVVEASVEVSSISTVPSPYKKREKQNKGLRSLYVLGMMPFGK